VQETGRCVGDQATRLSRYAEQFIIWASPAFGYGALCRSVVHGSSMMPQKRNPDAMELIRAKAARVIGQSTALLTLTKGLPLAYAKDLQEDKAALFDSQDTAFLVVNVFREAISSTILNVENMLAKLDGNLPANRSGRSADTNRRSVPHRASAGRPFVGALENEGPLTC
jgi:argininosuccinate lyase